MFAKARLLILATFALLSMLLGASVQGAIFPGAPIQQQPRPLSQDPNTVSIQTPGANARGRLAVIVSVDKSRVRVNELVRFTLSAASLVTNPKFEVTIDFGDGTRAETRQTSITHRYRATGHYDVYASVVSPTRPDEPRVPSVKLIASPTEVTADNRVSFTAQLSSNYPGIKYRFAFGDGSQTGWQDSPNASHTYAARGTYLAYVDLGIGNSGGIKQVGGSLRQPIVVTDRPKPQPSPSPPIIPPERLSVQLTANPTPVQTGKPVTFTARVSSPPSNIRYRFVFGDGSSPTGWQTDSQATRTYAAAGDYPAKVEIGRWNNGRVVPMATSNTKLISVTSPTVPPVSPTPSPMPSPSGGLTPSPQPSSSNGLTPSPSATSPPGVIPVGPVSTPSGVVSPPTSPIKLPKNWWVYLLIALLLIFVAYQIYRSLFMPRATFHPTRDTGSSEVDAGAKGLTINSQVLLRPNLSEGQYLVHTDEGDIIRSVRRENV
jgi:PKD repeat protein